LHPRTPAPLQGSEGRSRAAPVPPPDVLFLLQREVEVFRVLGDGGEDIAEVLFAPCPVVDVLVEEGERDVGRLPHELLLPGGVVVGVVF